jgi:lactoylglutathione lyase
MAYAINHIHLKSNDPQKSAEWWVQAFNFKIVSDRVREEYGDRFVTCQSENGVQVNISGARGAETLGPGDAGVHAGLEHFGLDSSDLDADIERLTALGAELLEGPVEIGSIRICFLRAPDDVRIELIQRTTR